MDGIQVCQNVEWDWHIYLHNWVGFFLGKFVGKHTNSIEHLGMS